jgi:hypothetical protein
MGKDKNKLVTPVIGLTKCRPGTDQSDCGDDVSTEAVWLDNGRLCWATDLQPAACDKAPSNQATEDITLLAGERPGKQNWVRFYGLVPGENASVFTIRAFGLGTADFSASFFESHVRNLGPNLVLGPDGTLYNNGVTAKQLQAVNVNPGGGIGSLTLTPDVVVGVATKDCNVSNQPTPNNDTVFRATEIKVPSDLCLPPGADIVLSAGQVVRFASGFSVKQGARLRVAIGGDR